MFTDNILKYFKNQLKRKYKIETGKDVSYVNETLVRSGNYKDIKG